jgi:hypothetical protein
MMSYDSYSYRVICEDKTHYSFILHFLKRKNANTRRIRVSGYSAGDGKKHVKTLLEKEKCDYSRAQSKGNMFCIVVRDADTDEYSDIYKELGCDKYNNIFLVIPKRNIETWLYFLTNPSAADCRDEKIDRKTRAGYNISDCVKELISIINKLPENTPESLKLTIKRLKECEQAEHKK